MWCHTDGKVNEIVRDLIEIGPEVSVGNIRAMCEAFLRHGRYDQRRT